MTTAQNLQDAITILNLVRRSVASGSFTVWNMLNRAANHLETQLAAELLEA